MEAENDTTVSISLSAYPPANILLLDSIKWPYKWLAGGPEDSPVPAKPSLLVLASRLLMMELQPSGASLPGLLTVVCRPMKIGTLLCTFNIV